MRQIRLVRLDLLMKLSRGRSEIVIALIDGPVLINHPDLESKHIRFAGQRLFACSMSDSVACRHGTFVAGILFAQRGSPAPAICPDCSLLLRPIFPERESSNGGMPSAAPTELAAAIVEVVEADARIINLSAALLQPASHAGKSLQQALDFAAARGVITVAAAGNQGTLGNSIITRHPWVIPVTGCDLQGRPTTVQLTETMVLMVILK